MSWKNYIASVILGTAVVGAAAPSVAATNILYILDASNSMWGQIEGVAKIETARDALTTLLGDTAAETSIGLMVYGHRSEGACDDIELVAPLGMKASSELTASIANISPKGKTPIAGALDAAGQAFPSNDAVNHIVLISDGIETCEGDPCEVAGKLAAAGIKTRVHAIGFDVGADARAQLECIAKAGEGSYFDAKNADEFQVAVSKATQIAQTETADEPEPEPAPTQFFFDDFDTELSEHWSVNNPNPDGFIVEDGNLLVVSSSKAGPGSVDPENFFLLNHPLPKGDWDAYATLSGEFKTGRDSLWFGLWKDPENFLGIQFWTKRDCCGCSNIVLRNIKSSSGDITQFDKPVLGSGLGCGSFSEDGFNKAIGPLADAPVKFGIHRRGRSYTVSMDAGMTDDNGDPIVYETDALTSLRNPGELSVAIGKWEDKGGEILIFLDSIEILEIKN